MPKKAKRIKLQKKEETKILEGKKNLSPTLSPSTGA